jgi:hypothetical protein
VIGQRGVDRFDKLIVCRAKGGHVVSHVGRESVGDFFKTPQSWVDLGAAFGASLTASPFLPQLPQM